MEISISQMMASSGLEAAAGRIRQLQAQLSAVTEAANRNTLSVPASGGASAPGTFKAMLQVSSPGIPTAASGAEAFSGLINQASQTYGLDKSLLEAVIRQESGFNPNAVSKAGAQGLMQLMPDTARTLGVSQAFDPAQNIDGGARYLKNLLDQFHGNVPLALAAYNAGSGSVKKYQGIPPYAETQQYVRSILADYLRRKESNS